MTADHNVQRQIGHYNQARHLYSQTPIRQSRLPQYCQKVLFDIGERLSGNGIPGDQHEFDAGLQFMLVQAKRFSEKASGAASGDRIADPPWGNNPESGTAPAFRHAPIGYHATAYQTLAFLPNAAEVPAFFDAHGAAETQPGWRFRPHFGARLDGRQAFAPGAAAIFENGLAALG